MHRNFVATVACTALSARLSSGQSTTTATFSPPTAVPTQAFGPVDPAFAGFAFEERSFYYFAGKQGNQNDPYTFSQNLIKGIAEKTGTKPVIRVGGTSLDHSSYNGSQPEAIHVPPGEESKGIPQNMVFGPSYFDAFKNFDARYTIDIPFANENQNNSIAFTQQANKSVSNIFSWEIGNEVNLYPKNGAKRPESWGPSNYSTQWENWAAALGLDNSGKVLQAGAFSSETVNDFLNTDTNLSDTWWVENVFNAGLSKDTDIIKSVSVHYYQTHASSTTNMQQDLMSHNRVVQGSAPVASAAAFLNKQNIPLVLGEVGNSLAGGASAEKKTDIQASLGSALWHIDFLLHSMSIGVSRVSIQSGVKFQFGLWEVDFNDVNATAHVLANYYGQMFVAEFIGAQGNVSVSELGQSTDRLTGYAAYEGDSLARIAVVNLDFWDGKPNCDNSTRPEQNVELDVGTDVQKVTIKKLTAPCGAFAHADENLTWAGMQWTVDDDGKGTQVKNDTKTINVSGGKVNVHVKSSEAVMVSMGA